MFSGFWSIRDSQTKPARGWACGSDERDHRGAPGLRGWLLCHGAANVDEVVGDHAEADPALHPVIAFVSAAVEAMSAFDHTDATLAAGAPFLTLAEPSPFLLASTLGTFG